MTLLEKPINLNYFRFYQSDYHMKQPVLTIAIADDNLLVRINLAQLLVGLGYHVCLVSPNGQELVDSIQLMSDPPHLCIVDINMEPLNGYETCQAIKAHDEDIKVIAYSLAAENKNDIFQYKHRFDAIRCKTDPIQALLDSIKELFKDQIVITGIQKDYLEVVKLI